MGGFWREEREGENVIITSKNKKKFGKKHTKDPPFSDNSSSTRVCTLPFHNLTIFSKM